MAKAKNKKRIKSDAIQIRKFKGNPAKPMNPFEVHINNEKIKVLGRKNKHEKGLPGVSRAKGIMKRTHTLLNEYKAQHKSNKFTDRRIGERNKGMTNEDRTMARFTAVRVKVHNRKSLFNLADDEVLTHRGQTLTEIEKFDDPRSDDEDSLDEEDKSGKLDRSFVEDAHFGGGILRNTGKEGAKTHKDLIEQLISESKKRKAEKQKTKEATLYLTEQLDTEWKDLLPLVNKQQKTDDPADKPKQDDYDKIMRELKFEARGTVSDRLKSEEELAKEEMDKLEQLEKDRLDRMKGVKEKDVLKPTHRSADDLDDDFVYDSEPEADPILPNDEDGKSSEDNTSDEDEETDSEDDLSDLRADSSESNVEDEGEVEKDSTISQESTKDLNNGVTIEKVIDVDVAENSNETSELVKQMNVGTCEGVSPEESQGDDLHEQIKEDLSKRKTMMESARKELPFTFSLPDSYENLQQLLDPQSSLHQGIIVERMIKCNHSSLAEGNKANLGLLFAYLLQYVNDAASGISVTRCFERFTALAPHLFDLAQLNQVNAHNSMVEVIKEKFQDYRKKPKEYPELETLIFFKLVSLLFSTSDFRHQVVTSVIVFMEQVLTRCRVKVKRDISYGLFMATLILEYSVLSKRFLPAVINYLGGILHSTIPKSSVRSTKVLLPFRPTSAHLVLLQDFSENDELSLKMECEDLADGRMDETYKVRAISTCVKLLSEFRDNFKSLSSNVEIFESHLQYLEMIPTCFYPQTVKKDIQNLISSLNEMKSQRKLRYIMMEVKKPKALRMLEPKIVQIYDGKRHKVQSREKAEKDKLLHQIKKVKKGTMREIRKDNAFLGRVKINQQIQSDKERRDKVKRIFSDAAIQQSELNEIDRKKKRK